jgi:hypothetical protein
VNANDKMEIKLKDSHYSEYEYVGYVLFDFEPVFFGDKYPSALDIIKNHHSIGEIEFSILLTKKY